MSPTPASPIREERQEAAVVPTAPAKPTPPARTYGDLYWTGVLDKNTIVSIDNGAASAGSMDGAALPGKAVRIEAYSPAIEIVEQPSADSGWTRFKFRCLRNSKASATVNFRWRLQ